MTHRLLRRDEVQARLGGIKKTTFFKMLRAGEIPPAVNITGNVRGWPEDEIESFIANRIAASRGASAATVEG